MYEINRETLTVLYTNIDQLTTIKKAELTDRITQEKPHIIAICEPKPKNPSTTRTEKDYAFPDYTLYSANLCTSSTGRGIVILTHSSIGDSVLQIECEIKFEEACILKINLRGTNSLLFGCFYRSPTSSEESDENNLNLNKLIKSLATNNKYTHKCFVGDFNLKDINWNTWTTNHNEQSKEFRFIEMIRDCYLYQHVLEPTRCRGSDDPSTLDLILTNEQLQISDLQYHAPIGSSDHTVITFKYRCFFDYVQPSTRYAYDKVDYEKIREYLGNGKEWLLDVPDNKSAEDLWNLFKNGILEIRDRFVPQKLTGLPSWKKKWDIPIKPELREAIKLKSRLHRRWIHSLDQHNHQTNRRNYNKARNKVKAMLRHAKTNFERSIGEKSKSNPKIFWAHVRSKMNTKSTVAPLLADTKDKTSMKFQDKEKANILQKQFVSVFTQEPNSEVPDFEKRTEAEIPPLSITEEIVHKKIMQLDINKACGPDEIHPRLVKELKDWLTKPITVILRKSFEEGRLPRDWKTANVSPLFKKGSTNKASNYRPISLTSIVCKIMESVIKDSITDHMSRENLLSKKQFGFINGRSTTTQLLNYLDKCVELIARKFTVDTIYFDFAKAFDTVPHQRLLKKLNAYGIKGKFLKWIEHFLSSCTQMD